MSVEKATGLTFAIVTPTYNRERLLERFVDGILSQTHKNFYFLLVHDGPIPKNYDTFYHSLRKGHNFIVTSTTSRSNDWGTQPRCFALHYLTHQKLQPDYIVFWDDDNKFSNDALSRIENQAITNRMPDVLLMNILKNGEIFPITDGDVLPHHIDTACLVTSFKTATEVYPIVADEVRLNGSQAYCQDNLYFDKLKASNVSIKLSSSREPICIYDGLRVLNRDTERRIDRILKRIPVLNKLWKAYKYNP